MSYCLYSPISSTDPNRLLSNAVSQLKNITPDTELDTDRIIMFDEIAFMVGKWEGVRSPPCFSYLNVKLEWKSG